MRSSSKEIFAALSTSDEKKGLKSPRKPGNDALSGEEENYLFKLSDKPTLASSEEVYVPENYRSERRARNLPLENNKNVKIKKLDNTSSLLELENDYPQKKQNCSIQ